LQSPRRYCARGGFFNAASEVIRAPSFEVALGELARHEQGLRLFTRTAERSNRKVSPAHAPELRAVLCTGVLAQNGFHFSAA
jgi:hypothetical protein